MFRMGLLLLRLGLLGALLAAVLSEVPAWHARTAYEALPDYDFAATAQRLLDEGRVADARLVADAGMASADSVQRSHLQSVRARIAARSTSVPYRLGQLGRGALLGQGDSAWALGGAMMADLFVFGDIRDLLMQGTHAVRGQPVDKVLVGLSALGLATTLSPWNEPGLDLLKAARRTGALSGAMARSLGKMTLRAVRTGERAELKAVAGSVRRIERSAGTGTTLRLLREVDDPAMLPRIAGFVEREPRGAFALWLTGRTGVARLKRGGRVAERNLALAARKGSAGVAWLRAGGARMLHFHPIVGLAKGIYSGHVGRFIVRLFDRHLPWLFGLCALWIALECMALRRRYRRRS